MVSHSPFTSVNLPSPHHWGWKPGARFWIPAVLHFESPTHVIIKFYWVGQKVCLTKTTFFIFTRTLLIWLFWVCRLSHGCCDADCSQRLDLIAVNVSWSARPWSIVQQEISSTKLHKPLLTHSISHRAFSILHFFFCISVAFLPSFK